MIFVVASRTADVMGGVGSGGIEGAAEMVARSVGQLGPVAYEHTHFEILSLGFKFPIICAGCLRCMRAGSVNCGSGAVAHLHVVVA